MDNNERYKVFVSHNRQQKPWVREAVSQWKSHDLNVFFDEEDIKPGQPVEEEIERGLKNSDYVFLILSPAAVNSYWVAFE